MALTAGKILGRTFSVVFVSAAVFSCAAVQGAANKAGAPGVPPKCPDVTKVDAIMAYDFSGNFKIDAAAGAKLKAGTAAAVSIKGFADQIDADLKTACGGIAKDLGATGDFKDGESACKAAAKVVGDVKAKLGASAKIDLVFQPPRCQADMNVMADCAGKCDAKVSGGKAKVECEPGKLSGSCDAQCSGSCDLKASAKCDGDCEGSCDAEVSGSCSGKCNGKCDGKSSSGASCAGKCEGKCDGGEFKGSCKGKCGGSCHMKAAAKCDGQCTGSCSVEMKAPKCTGEVKPPEMSADCKAHCNADVSAKMECTPAKVGLAITGAADAKLAASLQGTIEKNFPLILKVAIGMGERVPKLAADVTVVVQGVQGSIEGMAKASGNAAQAGMIAGQITACLGDTFKGALGAAGGMKGNFNASLEVKGSVSAGGGGSAGGKASAREDADELVTE
jgi:hypothetical protein